MTVDDIVKKFDEKPYFIRMGAGNIAKRLKVNKEDVKKARKIYHQLNDKKKTINLPNILIFDIETSPLKAYVWSRWKQNVYLDQTISEWFMLTWSAKWLFSSEIMSDRLTPEEVLKENDSRIVKSLWELIEKADIIVAHNGDKFDIPRINSRFLLNNLVPPSSYQTIDTFKIAKKHFGFSSNKLDALAIYFGFDRKLDTEFELWSKCMEGDEESLIYMEKYNRYDVELLEEVYLRLRPWMKSHPSVTLYGELNDKRCTCCGSDNITPVGEYITSVSAFTTYRCLDCGAISRERKSNVTVKQKKNLLVNVAR